MKREVPLEQITRQDFENYESIRRSGRFNMVTECGTVMAIMGVDTATYVAIQKHYGELQAKYPDIECKTLTVKPAEYTLK